VATINDPNVAANIAGVGAVAQKGVHVITKPIDVTGGGYFRVAAVTGTLAAALGAGSATVGHLFSLRNPHATTLIVIHYIRAQFQTLAAFTTPTVTDFGFDLFRNTGHTVQYTTNKTNLTPSKLRSSFASSVLGAADLVIATTVGMTGQTATQDANATNMCIGDPNIVNAAGGTEYANQGPPAMLIYNPNVSDGYPLTLTQNEGFVIRNRAAWAAAGTGILQVEVGWAEVTAY